MVVNFYLGICHLTRLENVSVMGLPDASFAGLNLARLVTTLQVASSSVEEPLDFVTVQLVALPSVPISILNPVVPCSSFLNEEGG
jgi:hypothetical protein